MTKWTFGPRHDWYALSETRHRTGRGTSGTMGKLRSGVDSQVDMTSFSQPGSGRGRSRSTSVGTRVRSRGQSLVEFSLVVPVFLMLIFGIIDFGYIYAQDIGLTNAVRVGARWASINPVAWSSSDPAPSGTIEGQVQTAANPGTVATSNIQISYWVPQPPPSGTSASSGTPTSSSGAVECGYFSNGAFTINPDYVGPDGTQALCDAQGNLVEVQASETVSPLGILFTGSTGPSITMSQQSTMMEEQSS